MFTTKGTKRMASAFTLVELIMVIVIIGLLAAIVVPRFGGQGDQARIASAQANLANLRSAVEVFRLQEGALPAALEDLLVPGPSTGEIYLRAIPEEALPGGAAPSDVVANQAALACADAGGWIYVTGGIQAGEVRVNRGVTACPVGSTCNPDNPCVDW